MAQPNQQVLDLEARAKALRATREDKIATELADVANQLNNVERRLKLAEQGAREADTTVVRNHRFAVEAEENAAAAEAGATKAERAGKVREADEFRESARNLRAAGENHEALARGARAEAEQFRTEAEPFETQRIALDREWTEMKTTLGKAESVIDVIEDKARFLREADTHRQKAADLVHEAELLREQGKSKDAYLRERKADLETKAAEAAQSNADKQVIDETAIDAAKLEPDEVAAATTTDASTDATSSAADDTTTASSTDLLDEEAQVLGQDADETDADADAAAARDDVDPVGVSSDGSNDIDLSDTSGSQSFTVDSAAPLVEPQNEAVTSDAFAAPAEPVAFELPDASQVTEFEPVAAVGIDDGSSDDVALSDAADDTLDA